MNDIQKQWNKDWVELYTKASEVQEGLVHLYYTLYMKGQATFDDVEKQYDELVKIEQKIASFEL
jgi:hypothetical protein